LNSELERISSIDSLKEQVTEYSSLTDKLVQATATEKLSQQIAYILTDTVALTVSRPVLEHFTSAVQHLAKEERISICRTAIDLVQDRLLAFEDSVKKLREILSGCLIENEEYSAAARVLSHINMENGKYDDSEKAAFYVKLAELFLDDDETVAADVYLNRSAQVVHNCTDENVRIRHKVSYARILDSKRKFLEASQRYYELSTGEIRINGEPVKEDELMLLLNKAVTCALLANAGPQRTRMLGTLTKDERSYTLSTHWSLLDKMYRERLLSQEEVQAFEHTLEPHQKAVLADGSTVLERAVIEHNILAASKLYDNVLFEELGKLLEIDPSKTELVVSRMIGENRLAGSIDQVKGLLKFGTDQDPLVAFDASIKRVCLAVNDCWEREEVQKLSL